MDGCDYGDPMFVVLASFVVMTGRLHSLIDRLLPETFRAIDHRPRESIGGMGGRVLCVAGRGTGFRTQKNIYNFAAFGRTHRGRGGTDLKKKPPDLKKKRPGGKQ